MQKSLSLAAASSDALRHITLQKMVSPSWCWRAAKISETAALPETAAAFASPAVTPRELPLVMYSIQHIWPQLSDMLDTNVEYYQEGNLRLGSTPQHQKILEGLADRAAACGVDVRMISGDEARRINPYLSDAVTCASWCPTDGHANPLMATMGYYKMARRLGAHFISGEKVVELRKIKGAARQVVTESGNVYEGDKIILAAGYESRFIASTVGIDVPMQPVLLETLVTEAVAPMFWQMLGTAAADFYGHQTEHGSFVFGLNSGLEPYAKPASPCPPASQHRLPAVASCTISRIWQTSKSSAAGQAGWMPVQIMCRLSAPWTKCRD